MRFTAVIRRVLVGTVSLLVGASAFAQARWDLPAGYAASNFHTENLQQFASDVDKATGGKLKITVHSNGSLFKANEIKRAVQGNQAQAGEILLANYENENALFGIDGIPFLATGYPDAMRLYKLEKPALEKLLASQGIKLLYTVAWPPQGIYTNKTLNSVADMRGLKWRAYSPATSKIAELVGAQPVTIQASELSQALATGVVDSYMSSGATGYDTKTYEQLKNWYDTEAWLPKNAVIVNQKAFDALDKATQDGLLKASAEAETRGWKVSEEKNAYYKKELAAKGMNILPPSPKFKADLTQIGTIMQADWKKKAGADAALVDAFNKK